MDSDDADREAQAYANELGERLRNVRQQQRLSLHDVEERSGGDLKASVLGAYERGERAVSVARLRALSDFYRVPVGSLLPSGDTPARGGREGGALVIDLTRLERAPVPADRRDLLSRYAGAIQAQRGDYNGRVLTVRASDVRAMAVVLDTDEDALRRDLVGAGVAQVR